MLRDAVFEAGDLFDEINTEALRCKVEAEYETRTATAQVLKKLSSRFKRFNRKVNSKLQKLFERLEHLRNQNLKLKECASSSVWHGTPTSSVMVDESAIYGRDNDKKKLKEFLLLEDGSDGGSKIGVISIVGMGWLGKTTLAKLLYNEREVKEKFDLKGWAHISKDFDVVTVTKTILESLTSKRNDTDDLNILQVQLLQCLSNTKFLLVLDDMWYGKYVDCWKNLTDIFNVGEIGSKIIITTRDERVATTMQTFLPIHKLEPLQSDHCWSLLAKHAFQASYSYEQRANLEVIGKEIAKKCHGLPLAAVALGGLLRIKSSPNDWNDVLKSSIWELAKDVQPALLLSYRYLPSALKGCFAYCSIFPKNSILEKKMVVQLWIAEGLVPQPKSEKSWEKVAEDYFDELVLRSLILQRSIDDEKICFEMHDLINDLATNVSSPCCVRLDEQKPHERVRHLSFNRGPYDSYDKFDKLLGLKGLRSFLPYTSEELGSSYSVSEKLVFDLLPTLIQLHVLSLSQYSNITKLPNCIGNLIYLRYLNLSHTKIAVLPSETCKLHNLQTLLLSYCDRLIELPKDMGKLVNLRHLDIRGTQLKEMPAQISILENLQTLPDFIVSMQDVRLKIADLGKYPHLRGSLSISQLQNVTDTSHVFEAKLEMKKQIHKLVLQWSDTTPSNSEIQSVVFERLRPSTNLKSLTINGYGGNNFPDWLGASSFSNMVCLRISHCENCSELPPLGQLANLKELFIGEMKSVKSVGAQFYGICSPSFQSFPILETLEFYAIPEWEEWKFTDGTTAEFPCLTRLSLLRCPKLQGNIPFGQLGKLKELRIELMESLKTLGTEFYGSGSSHMFQSFPSLVTLQFVNMPQWEEWELIGDTSIEFPRLTHLSLHNFPKLKGNIPGNLPSLTSLSVKCCPKLKGMTPDNLPSLSELELEKCPLLMESRHSDDISYDIIIRPSLDVSRQLMIGLNSLRKMKLSNIPSLTSFPRDGLPKTLQSLTIYDCRKLEFLPHESLKNYTSLDTLKISKSCHSMTSINLCSLPVLKSLYICGCKNLKAVLIAEDASQQNLLFLRTIKVENCHELESVSLGGLRIPNLIHLIVSGCKKLRLLPESMNTLASLQKMEIHDLPNLQSLSMDDFPISLRELSVGNVGGILWNTTWERLTSLSVLLIAGDDIVKALIKTEVPLLPAFLVSLVIYGVEDIKCLDGKWLQHLTSLQHFTILEAPKLESLPKAGKLPSSLEVLRVKRCPLLEASLRRKRGKEWRKVAHIPSILIDLEMIT
ncbi:unnamed protein product [Trifolium pratense]|uniref:Uncharacterized protein n=1 Tax=Trifolium pratense TaxID=57577 RepID=A0ACB0J3Z3_TRIPR|nr:unnamed protein product [Trifolium pratense]